jgi:hypothetical protein
MALKTALPSNLPVERNPSTALIFALISLVLGPPEERDWNLEKIKEICEAPCDSKSEA